MNAIVIEHPAVIKAEIAVCAHAAHTLSRLSVQKHNWAREAIRQGKLAIAEKYERESRRLRIEADGHLVMAQSRKDRHVHSN